MIICYLRSSALGSYEFCEVKYLLSYTLGYKDKINKKATAGTCCHKTLELLGKIKLATDKKLKTIKDDDLGRLKISECSLARLNDLSFNYYQKHFPILTDEYRKICLGWVEKAVSFMGGDLDPRNQPVLSVEEYFDFTIEKDWAKYSYEVNGEIIEGQLSIKGTVDLILFENDDTIHVCDYKTGRRFNWATEKVKDYKSLQHDHQLLFYFFALKNKYPTKEIIVSIYYINDHVIDKEVVKGGLFTMVFGEAEYKLAEDMIRRKFETIKSNVKPKPLSASCSHWKCRSLCAFSQVIPEIDTEKSACIAIREQIAKFGMDAVTNKYIDLDKIKSYSSGGGRLSAEDKVD